MLRNLHVKNMALIREIDVDFSDGLTILTGETGAGKSILIGSLQLALGGRLPKDLIKEGQGPALIEAVFEVDDKTVTRLQAVGVEPEDGLVIISRRIDGSRSVFRLNSETVTASLVRDCASVLIDIHGQHENQTLLKNEAQLALLDEFGGEAISRLKSRVREDYKAYQTIKKEASLSDMPEEERARQADFLRFEIEEIEAASVKVGEDDDVEVRYKKLANARRIIETATVVHELTGYEASGSAGDSIGSALRELESLTRYDEELERVASSLREIDALLNDFNRELARYLSDLEDDPQAFEETEERLNVINHLKVKYGQSVEMIHEALAVRKDKLKALEAYEEKRRHLGEDLKRAEESLSVSSNDLTKARIAAAAQFEKEASGHFLDLNFDRADFHIAFSQKSDYTGNGIDDIEFMIATNPGQPVLPLKDVASGGELSRIMLGIRTMFANRDDTETLIFDEIDTGISGRTAQKVAEKLSAVAAAHQTLCITHLPQIAAMADNHMAIAKTVTEDEASTHLEILSPDEAVNELARLIGGAAITESTLNVAREMQLMSGRIKAGIKQERDR